MFTQNYDYCKSYKTLDSLTKALSKYDDAPRALPIIIPYGKNAGRYTAIFPAEGGANIHWCHRGFIIVG